MPTVKMYRDGEACRTHRLIDCPDPECINRPSQAYRDANGNYIPDELNQPLAYADLSAHDNGQFVHPAPVGSHLEDGPRGNGLNGAKRG